MTPRGPAYRVTSPRLLARCWSPTDAELVRDALDASDEHLRPWIPFMRDEPRTLPQTVDRLRLHRSKFDTDENYRYGLFTADGRTLVGEAMLLGRSGPGSFEIGYWIDVRHTGKGYATEATSMLVRVAFEVLGVQRVEIHCEPANEASAAIPRKLGFTHEATLRGRLEDLEGRPTDQMIWSLFLDAYPLSPAHSVDVAALDYAGRALM